MMILSCSVYVALAFNDFNDTDEDMRKRIQIGERKDGGNERDSQFYEGREVRHRGEEMQNVNEKDHANEDI